MSSRAEDWIDGYVRAWRSNDPEDIGALFTDDARYLTAPDAVPREGREAIVAGWLEDSDDPEEWTFEHRVISDVGDLALVQGRTEYRGAANYLNLWIIRFAEDGRATEFTEWYMRRRG